MDHPLTSDPEKEVSDGRVIVSPGSTFIVFEYVFFPYSVSYDA